MELKVSPAPHIGTRLTIKEHQLIIAVALMLCLGMGMFNYGTSVIITFIACVGTSTLLDFIIQSALSKKIYFDEYSGIITGLVIACLMPVNAPWYLGIIASAIAIASKFLFGGLGNNIFNPAALGRSVLAVLSVNFSFGYFGDGNTILSMVINGTTENLDFGKAFMGGYDGAIGTTFIIGILIVMVVMAITQTIRWENLVSALLAFFIVTWLTMGFKNVLPMLLSGSFIFVMTFMLSDPVTSPYNFSARCIYSLIFGGLAALFMNLNVMGEGAVLFALLVANIVAPGLDKVFSLFHRGVSRHD